MKFVLGIIFKPIKLLIKLTLVIIGLFTLLQILYSKLQRSGVIKSEWTAQKTPSGKGLRFVMSVFDKFFISFQI